MFFLVHHFKKMTFCLSRIYSFKHSPLEVTFHSFQTGRWLSAHKCPFAVVKLTVTWSVAPDVLQTEVFLRYVHVKFNHTYFVCVFFRWSYRCPNISIVYTLGWYFWIGRCCPACVTGPILNEMECSPVYRHRSLLQSLYLNPRCRQEPEMNLLMAKWLWLKLALSMLPTNNMPRRDDIIRRKAIVIFPLLSGNTSCRIVSHPTDSSNSGFWLTVYALCGLSGLAQIFFFFFFPVWNNFDLVL